MCLFLESISNFATYKFELKSFWYFLYHCIQIFIVVLCTQCTPCRASVLLRFFGFEPMTYGAVGYLLCAMLKYFHYVKLKLKSHLILNHLVQFSYFVVVSLFAAFPGIYARSKKGVGEECLNTHNITTLTYK